MIKYISIIFLFFFSIHLFFSQESTINRIDENGRKQDQWIFYYPDGGIKEIHYYKDDKLDGWFSSFYEKDLDRYDIYNSLKEQIFYKNGLKHGNRIQLSPLGKLVLQCYYENDTLERKYCSYEQGVLMYFCFYEKGKINGELRMLTSYKTFYNRYERKVNCIVYYTHGRIDSSLYFYETDEIKHRSMYENNQIIWEDKALQRRMKKTPALVRCFHRTIIQFQNKNFFSKNVQNFNIFNFKIKNFFSKIVQNFNIKKKQIGVFFKHQCFDIKHWC